MEERKLTFRSVPNLDIDFGTSVHRVCQTPLASIQLSHVDISFRLQGHLEETRMLKANLLSNAMIPS